MKYSIQQMILTINSHICLICYKDDGLGSVIWRRDLKVRFSLHRIINGKKRMNNKEQSKHIQKDLDNSLG